MPLRAKEEIEKMSYMIADYETIERFMMKCKDNGMGMEDAVRRFVVALDDGEIVVNRHDLSEVIRFVFDKEIQRRYTGSVFSPLKFIKSVDFGFDTSRYII